MKEGSRPRTSKSGFGCSDDETTRTDPAATPALWTHAAAFADEPRASTTTWLVATSTYQPATTEDDGRRRSSEALTVRSVDSLRATRRGVAPAARTVSAA